MFAYLIIGTELIILYFVFWVVFIREPKPREIRAEMWGCYQEAQKDSNPNINRGAFNLADYSKRAALLLPIKIRINGYQRAKWRKLRRRHKRKYYSDNPSLIKTNIKTNHWHRYPMRVEIEQNINRELAEKFLLVLNKTLNKFSVKIPN